VDRRGEPERRAGEESRRGEPERRERERAREQTTAGPRAAGGRTSSQPVSNGPTDGASRARGPEPRQPPAGGRPRAGPVAGSSWPDLGRVGARPPRTSRRCHDEAGVRAAEEPPRDKDQRTTDRIRVTSPIAGYANI
jgi:hypothetical protein